MDEIPDIMRNSVISLNFSNSRGDNQIKARTFEVPGAGGFLLTDAAEGLDQFYRPDKEIAVFSGTDDLAGKILHFLSHSAERDAIARSGYERTRREHTYEQRMTDVIEYALKARMDSPPSMTPSFDKAVRAHRMTLGLRMLRTVLLTIGYLIYGAEKAPRAARRLVFELSWRLMREHTFTATGWPGRMFPHD